MNVTYVSACMDSSGYAEAARNHIAALDTAGVKINVVPISFEGYRSDLGRLGAIVQGMIGKNPPGKIQIIHATPQNYPRLKDPAKYNIGYCAWETDLLPAGWAELINSMNEVWVPSNHNAEVMKDSGVVIPIRVMPHPFRVVESDEGTTGVVANVDKNDFVFYSIFQWCYDKETRVLTQDGFKFFSDLSYNDKLATFNKETEELEYQKPNKIVSFHRKDKMLKLENQAFNLCITPDHRLLVRHEKNRDWKLIPANELINPKSGKFGTQWRTKKSCKWQGKEKEFFYPDSVVETRGNPISLERIPMDSFLSFLGWYISEGSIFKSNGYYIEISQKKQEDYIRQIKECIEKCGYHPFRVHGGIRFSSKQLYDYVSMFGKSSDKYIPSFVKDLSSRQIKILLDSLFKGDGSFVENEYQKYVTTSKQLAEDILECLLKIGYSGSISKTPPKNGGKINGRQIVGRQQQYIVSVNKTQNEPSLYYSGKQTFIDYDDKIYCVSVPNETLLVERNGKILFCGNTERKNPVDLLRAYMTEFKPDENVAMVLKTYVVNPSNQSEAQRIRDRIRDIKKKMYLKEYPKILLISSLLSKNQIRTLHTQCDCYVSLHRCEGFGIPFAEAMLAKNPVIATEYGGPADFMKTQMCVKYQMTPVYGMPWSIYTGHMNWAQPDLMHARKLMRWAFDNQKLAKHMGEKGYQDLLATHSWEAIGKKMKDRLEEISRSL